MKCPYCGHLDNKVIDSRLSQGGEVTRRRRECDACTRRYTTYERVEQVLPIIVKRDGRRQPFDRMKALAGLEHAVVKRPVSSEALDRLLDGLERDLADMGEREVGSQIIGEKILHALRNLDPVAYVRFASVYRKFDNVDEFTGELKELATRSDGNG
ncbi:MAG: transcriptional regulator NrdR [Polyangiales bacterium]